MMIHQVIDNRNFKIIFGTLVGIPSTFVLIVCSFYAAILTKGLLSGSLSDNTALLVISYYFGILGFFGAWLRLIITIDSLDARGRFWLRFLITSGLISTILLSLMFILEGWYLELLLPISLFAIGFLFLLPIRPQY